MLYEDTIAGLRITLASPEQIRAWSSGEVTQPHTINYLTLKPESDGLFSEQVFGPVEDWTCACGKYKRARTPGFRCERCGVDICERKVRRERLGHIELAVPVAHPWFARKIPSILALLLNISPRKLHAILAYTSYLILQIDDEQRKQLLAALPNGGNEREKACYRIFHTLQAGDLIDASTFAGFSWLYGKAFRASSGAGALREWLGTLDLDATAHELRQSMAQGQPPQKRAAKRLQIVEALRTSRIDPSWMILSVLPVLPPELRPLVPLESGRFASSDVNALYERVLHRNNRIKQFMKAHAPEIMLNHERRMLQEAVDALFDNKHRPRPVLGLQRHPLKSLTDMISGKRGRFRYNLLGKRVDYSGRSVVVGDPTLFLQQCGLPTKMCLELFKPFVIRKLLERQIAPTVRAAKRLIERPRQRPPVLWDLLEEVMFEKVVLLNRAPTLHRLSIQAFEAKRVEGNALRLHPLVCSAFNADFDGDQMAVHLPLSDEAQREARELLLSVRNLQSAANGEPSISVSQEMVLGLFYLTQDRPSKKRAKHIFSDATEARIALEHHVLDLHTPIIVRVDEPTIYESADVAATALPPNRRIETTAGRLIFNEILPTSLGYRNYGMNKDALKQLLAVCLRRFDQATTAQLADDLKRLGFAYATKSGISFALSDIEVPAEKQILLAQADAEAEAIEDHYHQGMMTADERYRQLIELWTRATDEISQWLEAGLDPWGSLATMIKSGATKAKFQQIRQLSGIRGLMARPSGKIIEIPIRGNYVEGLNVRESFVAGSAARNGFMGRSLNTATTGHLTRKLVETGMAVWITMEDCGTRDGFLITHEESQAAGLSNLRSRIIGRILAEPVAGEASGQMIDDRLADHLQTARVSAVRVRSVLMCQARSGVCQLCYGSDLATGKLVKRGMAVGVIAGQSIGEPGTQLSMRAFHAGGIANAQGDIRQGLPRVIELFETHTPQPTAPLARRTGTVEIEQDAESGCAIIRIGPSLPQGTAWCCTLAAGQKPSVAQGQVIECGTPVALGALDPRELLDLLGREALARYLMTEVQRVFRTTGVTMHDKHLECIIRQMLRYVQVGDAGDTLLLPGEIIDRFQFHTHNLQACAQGGQPATARPVLLGLTKTVLHTPSWMAAASFQETSRVLLHAALRGETDHLTGIKERVIAGLSLPDWQQDLGVQLADEP